MGQINQLVTENEELKLQLEELTVERNKFRSQANMRQNAKQHLSDENFRLLRELEHAQKQIKQLLGFLDQINNASHVAVQDYFALEDAHAER